MKKSTLGLCCLLALTTFACGKKSKKGGPAANQSGIHLPGEGTSEYPGQNGSCWDSVSQNDACHQGNDNPGQSDGSVQNLVVVSTNSWRYTDEARNGSVDSTEKCAQALQVRGSQLDLSLNNMGLRSESNRSSISARCLVQAQVTYPRGWAFAIKRISAQVTTANKNSAQALFEGTYQIDRNAVIATTQTFNRNSQNNLVEKNVATENLDWSGCDGQATIAMHTVLSMQSNSGAAYGTNSIGDMSVKDYRFEIVWAKCR